MDAGWLSYFSKQQLLWTGLPSPLLAGRFSRPIGKGGGDTVYASVPAWFSEFRLPHCV